MVTAFFAPQSCLVPCLLRNSEFVSSVFQFSPLFCVACRAGSRKLFSMACAHFDVRVFSGGH